MNHNIGDVVRIRTDLRIGGAYGNCEFVQEMSVFMGNSVTVTEILPKDEQYRVNIDNGMFYWHDDMFVHSWKDRIIGFVSKNIKPMPA